MIWVTWILLTSLGDAKDIMFLESLLISDQLVG
jgi:hypothetical protein